MNMESLVVGEFEVNCFVLWDGESRALVIDPGADAQDIADLLTRNGLRVEAYLLTHGHVDHVSALADLCDAFPAPVGIHPLDEQWAFGPRNHMLPSYNVPRRPSGIQRLLDDGQAWTDGELSYSVLSTPGHTPGSVCFYFESERVLISGDTLFAGSVGRTDLPGGDGRALAASLRKLARLPDATRIYPGHGPDSTIAMEKRDNVFMRSAWRDG